MDKEYMLLVKLGLNENEKKSLLEICCNNDKNILKLILKCYNRGKISSRKIKSYIEEKKEIIYII